MKQEKLIDKYYRWMESGMMDKAWLRLCLKGKYFITLKRLLQPSFTECITLWSEGICAGYWDSGVSVKSNDKYFTFTPLRQTIVLLICAIHGEL